MIVVAKLPYLDTPDPRRIHILRQRKAIESIEDLLRTICR